MVLSGDSEMDCVPADDNCGVSMPATWSDPKSAEGVETRYARMGVALNKTGESIFLLRLRLECLASLLCRGCYWKSWRLHLCLNRGRIVSSAC